VHSVWYPAVYSIDLGVTLEKAATLQMVIATRATVSIFLACMLIPTEPFSIQPITSLIYGKLGGVRTIWRTKADIRHTCALSGLNAGASQVAIAMEDSAQAVMYKSTRKVFDTIDAVPPGLDKEEMFHR
jgi:hypothetical protein